MSTTSTLDYIYGPISQKYCLYFYILSVIGFVLLLFVVIATIYQGFTKKHPMSFYLSMVMLAVLYAMFYLQNRLLYNMCMGTIKKEGMDILSMIKEKKQNDTNESPSQ